MILRELSNEEFQSCFHAPMRDVTQLAEPVVNIWPYVEALIKNGSTDEHLADVAHVYRDSGNRYDQVLIDTPQKNVFLVIVIDLSRKVIFGHCVLNLNTEYGLD